MDRQLVCKTVGIPCHHSLSSFAALLRPPEVDISISVLLHPLFSHEIEAIRTKTAPVVWFFHAPVQSCFVLVIFLAPPSFARCNR